MKVWFPNAAKWIVMWVDLMIAGLVGTIIGEGYRGIEGTIGAVFGVMWVVIASVFVVWMLESRRRKSN